MAEHPDADWLHLGPSAESESLNALHDAVIVRVQSDRLARTASVTLDFKALREFMKAPPTMRFVLAFDGVRSARVSVFVHCPGEDPRNDREESIDWSAFEASFASDADWLDVMEGEIARGGGRRRRAPLRLSPTRRPVA